jgi:hypothetical protein
MEINFVGRLKEGSFSEPPWMGSRRAVQNSITIVSASKSRRETNTQETNQRAVLTTPPASK